MKHDIRGLNKKPKKIGVMATMTVTSLALMGVNKSSQTVHADVQDSKLDTDLNSADSNPNLAAATDQTASTSSEQVSTSQSAGPMETPSTQNSAARSQANADAAVVNDSTPVSPESTNDVPQVNNHVTTNLPTTTQPVSSSRNSANNIEATGDQKRVVNVQPAQSKSQASVGAEIPYVAHDLVVYPDQTNIDIDAGLAAGVNGDLTHQIQVVDNAGFDPQHLTVNKSYKVSYSVSDSSKTTNFSRNIVVNRDQAAVKTDGKKRSVYAGNETNHECPSKWDFADVIDSDGQAVADADNQVAVLGWDELMAAVNDPEMNYDTCTDKTHFTDFSVPTKTVTLTYQFTALSGQVISVPVTVQVMPNYAHVQAQADQTIPQSQLATDQWQAADGYDLGSDENGITITPADKVETIGNVDVTTAGLYETTYTYTDGNNHQHQATTQVTVSAPTAKVVTHGSTIVMGPNTPVWQPADNLDAIFDSNGQKVDNPQFSTDQPVDVTQAGEQKVNYHYTDEYGNDITSPETIHLVRSQVALVGQNLTLVAGPNTTWNPIEGLAYLTDETGNKVQPSDLNAANLTVSGDNVDPHNPGVYNVHYVYIDSVGNQAETDCQVTVVPDISAIEAQGTTVTQSNQPAKAWTKNQSLALINRFLDEHGSTLIGRNGTIDPDLVTISYQKKEGQNYTPVNNVDVTTPGYYEIDYSYTDHAGKTSTSKAIVMVAPDIADMTVQDITVTQSNKATNAWNDSKSLALINRLVNERGNTLIGRDGTIKPNLVTISYQKKDGDQYTDADNVDVTTPGYYEINYSYTDGVGKTVTSKATVMVAPDIANITAQDTTVTQSNKASNAWNDSKSLALINHFVSENGNTLIGRDGTINPNLVTISYPQGDVDVTTPGQYPINYSYTDNAGKTVTATAKVTVNPDVANLATQGTTVSQSSKANASWTEDQSLALITQLVDEKGNSLLDSKGQVIDPTKVKITYPNGKVDVTTPGHYEINYSYTDNAGKTVTSQATVVVASDIADITAQDTTITQSNQAANAWNDSKSLALINRLVNESGNTLIGRDGTIAPGLVTISYQKKDGDQYINVDNVDVTTPGYYEINYSYTDGVGKTVTSKAMVMVAPDIANITAQNTTVTQSNQAANAWNKSKSLALINRLVNESGNTLIGRDGTIAPGLVTISYQKKDGDQYIDVDNVDVTTPGYYEINYSYTDGAGKTVTSQATVMVAPDIADITAQDTTVTQSNQATNAWNKSKSLALINRLVNESGNTLIGRDGTINPNLVTISYQKKDGDQYIDVDNVDVTTPGYYEINYSYTDHAGKTVTAKATVMVAPDIADITAQDTTVTQSNKATNAWNDNKSLALISRFVSESGNTLIGRDGKINPNLVTISYQKKDGDQYIDVDNVDVTTPGYYEINYSYTDHAGKTVTAQATVMVAPDIASITAQNTTVTQSSQPANSWNDNKSLALISRFVSESGNTLIGRDGKIDPNLVTISYPQGNVDVTTPGQYQIDYSYTDHAGKTVTTTATVTVKADQAQMQTQDQTITQSTDEHAAWTDNQSLALITQLVDENGSSLLDSNGKVIDPSQVTISYPNGPVDVTKPGNYEIVYSYTDHAGKTVTAIGTVTVVPASKIMVHNTLVIIGPNTPAWQPADNFDQVTDSQGRVVTNPNYHVDGSIDVTQAGDQSVIYHYTDDLGNDITASATVKVANTQVALTGKNQTIVAAADAKWQPISGLDHLVDEYGNIIQPDNIDTSRLSINGDEVDPTKPGNYQVHYIYTDLAGNQAQADADIQVLSPIEIKAHDSTIIAGPQASWKAQDNLTSATDENGSSLNIEQLQVTGADQVNPQVPGDYVVTYEYTDQDGNHQATAVTVHVVLSQVALVGKDQTVVAGTSVHWDPVTGLDHLVDEQGNLVQPSAIDPSRLTISGDQVDLTTPGKYVVHYVYTDSAGNQAPADSTITVVADVSEIKAQATTLIAKPNAQWSDEQSLALITSLVDEHGNSLLDSDGKVLDPSQVVISYPHGKVDPSTPGEYQINYSYTDGAAKTVTDSILITVQASKAQIITHPSTITAGADAYWDPMLNLDLQHCTDEKGNPLNKDQIKVTGSVDVTTPGTYTIHYAYVDSEGNTWTQQDAVVTVKAKATDTNTGDNHQPDTNPGTNPTNPNKPGEASSYTVHVTDFHVQLGDGRVWTPQTTFAGITDAAGQPVSVDTQKIPQVADEKQVPAETGLYYSGNVNIDKVGDYYVTYYYRAANGQLYQSIAHIQVAGQDVKPNYAVHVTNFSSLVGDGRVWTPKTTFAGITDREGHSIAVDTDNIQQVADVDHVPTTAGLYYSGNVNVNEAGDYFVTYYYRSVEGQLYQSVSHVKIAGKNNYTVHVTNFSLQLGTGQIWTPQTTFAGITDEVGQPVTVDSTKISQVSDQDHVPLTVGLYYSGTVDLTKAGDYTVIYYYRASNGQLYQNTSNVKVTAKDSNPNNSGTNNNPAPPSGSETNNNTVPATPAPTPSTPNYVVHVTDINLPVGSNWTPQASFSGLTDKNGYQISVNTNNIEHVSDQDHVPASVGLYYSGQVNTQKTGNYSVTYYYRATDGKLYQNTAIVKVTDALNQPSATTPPNQTITTTKPLATQPKPIFQNAGATTPLTTQRPITSLTTDPQQKSQSNQESYPQTGNDSATSWQVAGGLLAAADVLLAKFGYKRKQ